MYIASLQSTGGSIYLYNSSNGDASIGIIQAANEVEISVGTGNITDYDNTAAVNIFANTADLMAANIGSAANPFDISLSGNLTASSAFDIYIIQPTGNLNINNVNSTGSNVYLTANTGELIDGIGTSQVQTFRAI